MKKIRKHYEDTKKFFDEAALGRKGYYDKKKSLAYKTQQYVKKILINLIGVDNENTNKILDAGCGSGDFSILLAQQFPASRITGADYSKDMITVCEQAKKDKDIDNIKFMVADLLNTPFDDNEFDITVCVGTLHHIHKKDLDKVIKEIARITKKTVILEIKNRNTPYHPIKKLKSRLLLSGITVYGTTVKEMGKLFGGCGFELTSVTSIFKFAILSPIIVLKFKRPREVGK